MFLTYFASVFFSRCCICFAIASQVFLQVLKTHVSSVSSVFRRMLQMFHMDVFEVNVCCKCFICMFQLLERHAYVWEADGALRSYGHRKRRSGAGDPHLVGACSSCRRLDASNWPQSLLPKRSFWTKVYRHVAFVASDDHAQIKMDKRTIWSVAPTITRLVCKKWEGHHGASYSIMIWKGQRMGHNARTTQRTQYPVVRFSYPHHIFMTDAISCCQKDRTKG